MKRPSSILQDLVNMDDESIDLFFEALESGMRDEWDCPLLSDSASQFGAAEFRVAAKDAIGFAESFEHRTRRPEV